MDENQIKAKEFTQELIDANKLGAKTLKELNLVERRITSFAIEFLKNNPIHGNFDLEHLKLIHKFIFDEVYTFAGQTRAEIGKGRESFGKRDPKDHEKVSWFVHGKDLHVEAQKIFEDLRKNKKFFTRHSKKEFVEEGAEFFIELNRLHPFREGNGRTQRMFMKQLAEHAGYKLDLNNVRSDRMSEACIAGMNGDRSTMVLLFKMHIYDLDRKYQSVQGQTVIKKARV